MIFRRRKPKADPREIDRLETITDMRPPRPRISTDRVEITGPDGDATIAHLPRELEPGENT
jgi:hypothetical protein